MSVQNLMKKVCESANDFFSNNIPVFGTIRPRQKMYDLKYFPRFFPKNVHCAIKNPKLCSKRPGTGLASTVLKPEIFTFCDLLGLPPVKAIYLIFKL